MEITKQIVQGIIKFLQDEKTSGRFKEPDTESLDVAIQCLETTYKIDSKEQPKEDVLDFRSMIKSEIEISEKAKEEAEDSKVKGNTAMTNGEHNLAIEEYSKAISLNPKNPVYYCNRAAVYNKLEQPLNAILDCKKAIKLDNTYSKAYGRLGKAYSTIGLYKEAGEAYSAALIHEPNNTMYKENLENLEKVAAGVNAETGGLFSNSALLNMTIQLMENDNFRSVLEAITGSQNENEPSCLNNLLQMGQMLVNRMENMPNILESLHLQAKTENSIKEDSEPSQ